MMVPALLALAVSQNAPAPGYAQTATVPSPAIGMPMMHPPSNVISAVTPLHPPVPHGTIQSLVNALDYPAAARGTGAHGTVGFVLTIDKQGRASGCTITQSSGSVVLDSATCQIVQRRAHFTPAMDVNGNPTVGTYAAQVAWKRQ